MSRPFAKGERPLVTRLRDTIDETLRPLIAAGRPVALLDFPVFRNVGDSAIWLGTLSTLRRLGVPRPRYVCSFLTYSRQELARRIGDGLIVLSGGGNFGDAYEPHQWLREEVVANFRSNPILQLPQSIWFRDPAALERSRRIFAQHPSVTLLLRDRPTLEVAAREFAGARTGLCPDMAFGLGPMAGAGPATDRIVWLSRMDSESLPEADAETPAGVERLDWVGQPPGVLDRLAARVYPHMRTRARLMGALHPWLARTRLLRGVRMLRGARCVITDRLHAHVLCLLLGIPHYLLPNRNGKVRALYETWTCESPLARWCDSAPEALALALAERDAKRASNPSRPFEALDAPSGVPRD